MDPCRLEEFWFTLLHNDGQRALWHPELEIVFLLQGTGRVYFSDLKTAYTLQEKDIFVVNSFEVQDFELDGESAALSFSVSPEFVGSVAPELLKYRVDCRSFLHVEEKQSAFDVLRQDLARAFQALNKKERSIAAYSKSSAAVILEDLGRYFLNDNQPVERGHVQETLKNVTQSSTASRRPANGWRVCSTPAPPSARRSAPVSVWPSPWASWAPPVTSAPPPCRQRPPCPPSRTCTCWPPLPFLIAMPILYYFYKLDQIYPQVMAELEQRERQGKL